MVFKRGVTGALFRNAGWLFGGKTVAGLFTALLTVALARFLGATDYGLLVLAVAYVDILNAVLDWRMWETATKYVGMYWSRGEKDKARAMVKFSYVVDVSTGVVAFAVAVATAPLAVHYFLKTSGSEQFIYIYSASLLIATSNRTSDAILRVFDSYRAIAVAGSVTHFVRLALVSGVLVAGGGIKGVLLCYVAAAFAGFALRIVFVWGALRRHGLTGWWKAPMGLIGGEWKEIVWFMGNTGLTGTLKMLDDTYFAPLVLGLFAGKEAAAYYKVARSVTKVAGRIIDSVYEAIYPELVRMAARGAADELRTLVVESVKRLSLLLVPMAVLVVVFARPITTGVFGAQYAPAAEVLRVITVGLLIYQLTYWIGPSFLAMGRAGLRTYVSAVSTAAYLLLLVSLVPAMSYVGAAWAYVGYAVVRVAVAAGGLAASYRELEARGRR